MQENMAPRILQKRTRRAKPVGGPRSAGALQELIDATVRTAIDKALRRTGGNVTHAAQQLGLTRKGLQKRMASLGIDPARYRA